MNAYTVWVAPSKGSPSVNEPSAGAASQEKSTYADIGLDERLSPCPKCHAEYNRPGIRSGPTVVCVARGSYLPICLNCFHKANRARTQSKAIEHWNHGMDENPWRKRRHELGLSAKELSEKTGLCMESIYRAETGQVQPTKITVMKLETGLGMR